MQSIRPLVRKPAIFLITGIMFFTFLLMPVEQTTGKYQTDRAHNFALTESEFFSWQKKVKTEMAAAKGERPSYYQTQLDEFREKFIKIYRENPQDQIAFKSILYVFYSERSPTARREMLEYLTNYHIRNSELYYLLVGPIPPYMLTQEYEGFFQAAIKTNPYHRVKGSAMLALAQSWDMAVTVQIMLREFELEVNKYLELQGVDATSAMEQKRNSLNHWVNADIKILREKIKLQAEQVLTHYSDVNVAYYTPLGEKEVGLAGPIAKGLIAGITTAASGMPAPALVAEDLDKKPFDLAKLKGSVVMLDFWATWCVPCVAAIPGNRDMVARFKGQPFQLITLSVDDDIEDVHDFIQGTEMPFVNLYLGPEHPVLATWNVSSYPTVIIIDHKGIIRMRQSGETDALEKYLQNLVQKAQNVE